MTSAPKIKPFKGVRYDQRSVPNIADALAPPYDIISPDKQSSLYDRHDKNVVRLILGKTGANDTETDNRYTRAKSDLDKWLDDKTLITDEKPSIYLYAQDYEVNGEKLRRTGFICRRLIEPFGESVFRHERTLSGPKVDRLQLTRACEMNFSPVFGLYSDSAGKLEDVWRKVMDWPPDIKVVDDDCVTHTLWVVSCGEVISQVCDFMESKPVVIADGHHRYETALNYRNERREKGNGGGSADSDYVMMYLSNTHSQGFTLLPTHRIISDVSVSVDVLLDKLRRGFHLNEYIIADGAIDTALEDLKSNDGKRTSFGLYVGDNRMFLLTKRDAEKETDSHDPLSRLDVTILQDTIFEKILGVDRAAVESKKYITYTADPEAAIDAVDSNGAAFAFLLNKTDVNQVMEVAISGGVMPQKSTYFYPKLISGLVFNPLS